jgi:transcriptional regulator with XRE-family HTH domain
LKGGVKKMARRKYTEVEKNIIKEVSENLKRIIQRRGITQKYIADKTGLSTSTVGDYINGRTLIPPGNLELISNALEVQKSDIYPVEGNVKTPADQLQGLGNLDGFNAELLIKIKELADKHDMDLTTPEFFNILDSAFDVVKRVRRE